MKTPAKPLRGRPAKNRKGYKITLTEEERNVAGRRAFNSGMDFSAYLSALIRADNPGEFKGMSFAGK